MKKLKPHKVLRFTLLLALFISLSIQFSRGVRVPFLLYGATAEKAPEIPVDSLKNSVEGRMPPNQFTNALIATRQLLSQLPGGAGALGQNYRLMGFLFRNTQNYDKAIAHYRQALQIYRNQRIKPEQANVRYPVRTLLSRQYYQELLQGLETRYAIQEFEKQQAANENKSEQMRHLFIVILILLIALIAILILVIDNLKKKKQNLELANAYKEIQARKDALETTHKQLISGKKKLSAALNIAADGFIEISLNDDTIHYDQNFFQLVGHEQKQHREFIHYVHQDDVKRVNQLFNYCQENKQYAYAEFRLINHEQDSVWVQGRCVFLPVFNMMLMALNDISALKEKEAELALNNRELEEQSRTMAEISQEIEEKNEELQQANQSLHVSEQTYRSLTNNLPVGICRLDTHNNFIYANKSLASILDLQDSKKLIGRNFRDIFTSETFFNRWKNHKNKALEVQTKTFEQEDIWLKIAGIFITKDNTAYYDGIIEDITKKKKIESNLIKARQKVEESDRLKTQFLQSISHEIRTPLNAIVGFTRLLENPDISNQDKKEYREAITMSSNQLLNILEQIMDLSSIQNGQYTLNYADTNLGQSLDKLHHHFSLRLKYLHKADAITLKSQKPSKNLLIHTDPKALEKIFINLLENAVKFTHEGAISFGCRHITPNYGEFFVTDTGIGISHKNQKLIKKAFSKEDHTPGSGGLGIGLSMIRQLILLLDGELDFHSKEDEGTTFSVKIPNVTPSGNSGYAGGLGNDVE